MAQAGSDNLQKLVEERGRVKAALTRLRTYYDTRSATDPIKYLQARFEQHSAILAKFDALHWRIIDIVKGTAEEAVHERYRDEFEDSYYQLVGDVTADIQCAQSPVVPPNMQGLRIANISPAASETNNKLLNCLLLKQMQGR